MRLLWLTGGIVSFFIGFVGVFLPLVPTVPLMLLAAFCFAKSSDKAHNWLINHHKFGGSIADWRDRGAISLKSKIAATLAMCLTIIASYVFSVPSIVLVIQVPVLICVMAFIWTRPS